MALNHSDNSEQSTENRFNCNKKSRDDRHNEMGDPEIRYLDIENKDIIFLLSRKMLDGR